MSEFDSPWKEALDQFLPLFLAFFFPEVHAAIDWSRSYESLEKELQQIVREGELGTRLADKLFRVWRRDGAEMWVLIHAEVRTRRMTTSQSACTCIITGYMIVSDVRW